LSWLLAERLYAQEPESNTNESKFNSIVNGQPSLDRLVVVSPGQ
jgi:hypothetical protein